MATARLDIPPAQFWDMTPMELEALCEEKRKARPDYIAPVTNAEFEALKARFPDIPAKKKVK